MSAPRPILSAAGYRTWQQSFVKVGGRRFTVATKPGLFAHGRVDPSTMLLAEHARVSAGDVAVHMNCGNGLFGAVAAAAHGAGRVFLTDRNVVSVEAARRTIAANEVTHAEVVAGHGAYALPADLVADVVALRIPQEKLALLQLLRDAFRVLRVGGRCYVAGATNEGAKTAARTLESIFGEAGAIAHDSGHRIVVAIKKGETPASDEAIASPLLDGDTFAELDVTLRKLPFRLFTRPGVFSWEHLDEATALLAEQMEVRAGERVLDLGCGSGALGLVAATLSGTGTVRMVDADVEAVRSANRAATAAGLANASALASDVGTAVLGEAFDVVVTNPPFHVGKATDLDVPMQFINDAWELLAPGGRMYLVANRTLPYELPVRRRFGNIATVHDGRRFKILAATREAAPVA